MRKKEINLRAIHQASHAVGYLWAGLPFQCVIIDDNKKGEGIVCHISEPSGMLQSKDIMNPDLFTKIFLRDVLNWTGQEAELYFLPDDMLDSHGLHEPNMFFNPDEAEDEFMCNYSEFVAVYTSQIVQEHIEDIKAIAKELVKRKTLSYDEIKRIVKPTN